MNREKIAAFGPYHEGFDTDSAFDFYELNRDGLPSAAFPKTSRHAGGLLDISDQIDAFVFDAFGVLNVGGSAIAGASECVQALRDMGKKVFVLSNAATYQVHKNVEKYERLGIQFLPEEVVSSRMAASNYVNDMGIERWGVMGRQNSDPSDFTVETRILSDQSEDYDWAEAFLLLTTWDWNESQQLLLEAAIEKRKRLIVVANPDVIAPLEKRFSTEPGFTGHRLRALFDANVVFHGKPYPSVFKLIEAKLPQDIDKKRIAMIGDTLHTDTLGGAASGWSTVLVSHHGLFRGHDLQPYIKKSSIIPDFIVPSI